jgi:hypothetical protein
VAASAAASFSEDAGYEDIATDAQRMLNAGHAPMAERLSGIILFRDRAF